MRIGKIKTFSLSNRNKDVCLAQAANLLQARSELKFAYAYGSFLESGPFRDLDIALFLHRDRIPDRIYEYEADIERTLSKTLDVPFPIEARVANRASIPFLYAVIQGRLLVDRDPEDRMEFVAYVISRYLDIEPVLRHHAKEAFCR